MIFAVLIVQVVELVALLYLWITLWKRGGGGKTSAISHISSIVPPNSPQNFSQNKAPQGSIHYVDDDLEAIAVREGKAVDDKFFDIGEDEVDKD